MNKRQVVKMPLRLLDPTLIDRFDILFCAPRAAKGRPCRGPLQNLRAVRFQGYRFRGHNFWPQKLFLEAANGCAKRRVTAALSVRLGWLNLKRGARTTSCSPTSPWPCGAVRHRFRPSSVLLGAGLRTSKIVLHTGTFLQNAYRPTAPHTDVDRHQKTAPHRPSPSPLPRSEPRRLLHNRSDVSIFAYWLVSASSRFASLPPA